MMSTAKESTPISARLERERKWAQTDHDEMDRERSFRTSAEGCLPYSGWKRLILQA